MNQRVGLDRIIYFAGQHDGGYDVKFLSDELDLNQEGDDSDLETGLHPTPTRPWCFSMSIPMLSR